MAEHLLNLVLSDDAEMALSSLRDEARLEVLSLLEHLRQGREHDRVKFFSQSLATMPNHYVLQTEDWLIYFRLTDRDAVVLSIHRPDALKPFLAALQAAK